MPDAAPYRHALRLAGIDAAETFTVERTKAGLASAHTAGVHALKLDRPREGGPGDAAQSVLSDLGELRGLLP